MDIFRFFPTSELRYFLTEPVISRNLPLSRILSSNEEIAAAIMRILR